MARKAKNAPAPARQEVTPVVDAAEILSDTPATEPTPTRTRLTGQELKDRLREERRQSRLKQKGY